MKKIVLFIIIVIFSCNVFAVNVAVVRKKSASSFDIAETWNGSTEDETWSSLPSGWSDDYSANPINGAQSLSTSSTAGSIYASTTSSGNYYAVFKIDNLNTDPTGYALSFYLAESDGTAICSLRLYYDGDTDEWYRIYLGHSGDGTTVSVDFGENDIDASLVCVGKIEYEKGTGANGRVEVFFTSESDYNANGWTNAFTSEVLTSSDQADVGRLYIEGMVAAGDGLIIDDVYGSVTDNVDY